MPCQFCLPDGKIYNPLTKQDEECPECACNASRNGLKEKNEDYHEQKIKERLRSSINSKCTQCKGAVDNEVCISCHCPNPRIKEDDLNAYISKHDVTLRGSGLVISHKETLCNQS